MSDAGFQECVWDYPRPPRVEAFEQRLLVVHDRLPLADASGGYRVLETSHPPCYYLPPESVDWSRLTASDTSTYCEFKGYARYWHLLARDGHVPDVAWAYQQPTPSHEPIAGYICFYAGQVDACYVGDEAVTPQAGRLYGGWITPGIKGPFKGAVGTSGW